MLAQNYPGSNSSILPIDLLLTRPPRAPGDRGGGLPPGTTFQIRLEHLPWRGQAGWGAVLGAVHPPTLQKGTIKYNTNGSSKMHCKLVLKKGAFEVHPQMPKSRVTWNSSSRVGLCPAHLPPPVCVRLAAAVAHPSGGRHSSGGRFTSDGGVTVLLTRFLDRTSLSAPPPGEVMARMSPGLEGTPFPGRAKGFLQIGTALFFWSQDFSYRDKVKS